MGGLAIERFGRRYKPWLINMVQGDEHTILLDVLYNTEFVWLTDVPFDKNRAGNGTYLRARFKNESGLEYDYNTDTWPCSVLEMFVALAMDIEDSIMYEPELGDRTYIWFWVMLTNLGLDVYDDSVLSLDMSEDFSHIYDILEQFMERNYETDGRGGAFPMKHTENDQRFVELWYQANEYVMGGWMKTPRWLRRKSVTCRV